MTLHDYADNWQRYWETAAEDGRRLQIENAAADPFGRFLTADLPSLVDDEIGIEADHFRDHPDALLADARAGFESYVEASDLPGVGDERLGYDRLPVHVTAVDRVDWPDFSFRDPVRDANALTTMRNVAVSEGATRRDEAAVVTYRCPQGHETTIRQPLLRPWTIETCGESDCANEVVPDDSRTRARRVARFTVETAAGSLPCVVTGRYATVDEEFQRLANSSQLQLTGVSRLVTDAAGSLEPTYEVLAAEPSSP